MKKVKLLASGKPLDYTMENGDLIVDMTAVVEDDLNTVVEVAYKGELHTDTVITLMEGMSANLPLQDAILSGKTAKGQIRWMEKFDDWKYSNVIENCQTENDKVEWMFKAIRSARYYVYLDYNYLSEHGPAEGLITVGDQHLYFETIASTGKQVQHFFEDRIGIVSVEKGFNTLTIRPTGKGDRTIKLREVRLVPGR